METLHLAKSNPALESSSKLPKKGSLKLYVAKADLDKCLPAGWTSRDGGNNGSETTESLIYETAEDLARKESSDFYVYPIELRKEFDEMGNLRGGRPPGWRVTLNFQKSGTAAPAAEQ